MSAPTERRRRDRTPPIGPGGRSTVSSSNGTSQPPTGPRPRPKPIGRRLAAPTSRLRRHRPEARHDYHHIRVVISTAAGTAASPLRMTFYHTQSPTTGCLKGAALPRLTVRSSTLAGPRFRSNWRGRSLHGNSWPSTRGQAHVVSGKAKQTWRRRHQEGDPRSRPLPERATRGLAPRLPCRPAPSPAARGACRAVHFNALR